tara:strand:+ start:35 stop:241 length:207 start_codon:yes stop_codon:yes gene_type:complete
MIPGDLVRWIGFPGADKQGVKITGPSCKFGLIIKLYSPQSGSGTRVDVAWGDGTFGTKLYPQTIEVVN